MAQRGKRPCCVRKLLRIEISHELLCRCQCCEQLLVLVIHRGKRPCCVRKTLWMKFPHAPLCRYLGISPPSQKGEGSKEAHEAGRMQDLKTKNISQKLKRKHHYCTQKPSKMSTKFPQNPFLESFWGLVGLSWDLLRHLGRVSRPSWKKPSKNSIFWMSTCAPRSIKNIKKSMSKKHLF